MSPASPLFPVGTRFTPARKHAVECVVVDILTTRNIKGDVVAIRYVAEHLFCGQVVRNHDVLETTIARSPRLVVPGLPPP